MASMQRVRRGLVIGAFLVAGAAGGAGVAQAQPAQPPAPCLAWFGARDTGQCIGWANSSAPAWSVGNGGIFINPAQPGQMPYTPAH